LLYPTTLVTLIFAYWVDKVLFLKVYRLPKNIDEKMQNTVRNTLQAILILHISFAIWTYGNPDIFGTENQLSSSYSNLVNQEVNGSASYYSQQIGARIFLGHNVPLDILLALVIAMLIIRYFFYELLKRLFNLCCKCCVKNVYVDDSTSQKLPFYQLYSNDDLIDELQILDHQIRGNQSKQLEVLLNQRLNALELELKRREPLENYQQDKKFISLASYDVMLNPQYKPFIKAEIDSEVLSLEDQRKAKLHAN